MKKLMLTAALLMLCGPAFAQGPNSDKPNSDKSVNADSDAVPGGGPIAVEDPAVPASKSVAQKPPEEHGPNRGWYVDFGGEFGFLQEQTVKDGIIPGGKGELASDPGFGVTGALGYAWENGLRTEAELGYRRNNFDKVSGGAFGTRFTGGVDGHSSALSGMFNVLYDYDTKSAFTPYIGSGIGLANVTAESDRLRVDNNDVAFAYQFMGGVRYALTDNISLRTGYRYFTTTAPRIQGSSVDYGSHNIEMGLTFGF